MRDIERRIRVKLKRLDLKFLYEKNFKKLNKIVSKKRKKGRLKKYKEELILFTFALKVLKVLKNLSYKDIPNFLSLQIIYFIKKEKIKAKLIHATRFSYRNNHKLKSLRGKDTRKIKLYIRLEAIVLLTSRGYTFIDAFDNKR